MEDKSIIQLYWDRNDRAITATAEKYGGYCASIARNILGSSEDAEECVNDTYLNAWNAMPTHWPEQLSTFLGKITRNLSFNRYRNGHAAKRGGGETALILDELAECVSGTETVEQIVDRRELVRAINAFVKDLPPVKRSIFVRRYWYADAVRKIAADCRIQPGSVSKILERERKQLKTYLAERGFEL